MNRLDHLRQIMKLAEVEGFLISSKSNIFYLSNFNRFLVEHDGYLFVTLKNSFLITSPLYTEAVKKFTPNLDFLETSGDMWYAKQIKKVVEEENIKSVGFEENDLRVSEFFDLEDEKIILKSVSLRSLRAQKEKEEIEKIKKASQITDTAFKEVLPFIKEGVTELLLAEKITEVIKNNKGELGFPSIVAFGEHSAVPHHMTSDAKLYKNSFVLFDFGAGFEGYVSDMSRTVFFGKPKNEQIKLYDTVKKSQEAGVKYISQKMTRDNEGTGLIGKDVDEISRKFIEDEGFASYPHALGHGVGLEVHEAPTLSAYSKEPILENMVFTLEPGIYQPAVGGVRIEDVFVIENYNLIQLTNSPKELIVL